MSFTLNHVLVSNTFTPELHETAQGIFFTVATEGTFDVLYPGRLDRQVTATVRHSMRIDTPDTTVPQPPHGIDQPGHPDLHPSPTPTPLHNGVVVTVEAIPSTLRIFDPSGALFTRDEVTLGDINKFRDLRGSSKGHWRYTLTGQSRVYHPLPALNESVGDPRGSVQLGVFEHVASSSAPPLVPRSRVTGTTFRTQFDLNRVGTFHATVSAAFLFPWHGTMRLLDPNGVAITTSNSKRLSCPIPLAMLGRSRDAAGNPRMWTLEVTPQGVATGTPHFVTATVLGEGRFTTAGVKARIEKLLGPHGSFISLVGENSGGKAKAMLTIRDVAAAETIDMHGLLDSRLKKEGQSTDIEANKPMVLYQRDADLDHGLTLDVSTVKLRSIDVDVGPGRHLGAQTPTVHLAVRIDGEVKVKWHGLTLAHAGLEGGKLELEVGVRVDPDGTPRIVQWVTDEAFDIDISAAVMASLIALLLPLGITAAIVAHYIEEEINKRFAEAVRDLFTDPALAPQILMTLFGTHLTYVQPRFDGPDLLFEHIAPLEPDPKPRHDYAGAIGRSVMHLSPGVASFMPRTLGDTWKADNLKAKIDHIVVVMMENRSYDHVLGYRAQTPTSDGADGLTPELMAAVAEAAIAVQPMPTSTQPLTPVHPLRLADFATNEVGLRTRIPKGVGHELDDVEQQLASRVDGPGGRKINDPRGFMENFRDRKLGGAAEGVDGCTPFTVLGYYEKNTAAGADDLPITAFLAEHYAYSDTYYCSHPGPTLPNRMYSLTGDVQHDRFGVPILDNNHGDNFLLSRAPTIYDFLTRRGVSWRVYESFPSVTMLRMFARYATDEVNIRPIDELERDARAGNLPSLTVIEPAMHHHPEDDDHPPADMYRGQHFLRRVYEALRANPQTWAKTLLIVTYDEHGGLYDHVIPPIADVLQAGRPGAVFDDRTTGGELSPDSGTPGGLHPVPGRPVPGRRIPGASTGSAATADASTSGTASPHGTVVTGPRRFIGVSPDLLDAMVHATDIATTPETPSDPTLEIPYGVRVPTLLVSPWVKPGKGPSVVLDHCSILKTILARFCGDEKPFLSDRVHASHSFEAFVDATDPAADPGAPPVLQRLTDAAPRPAPGASSIITPPLYRKRMRHEQVDYHDISGRLARMLGR